MENQDTVTLVSQHPLIIKFNFPVRLSILPAPQVCLEYPKFVISFAAMYRSLIIVTVLPRIIDSWSTSPISI
jgi:hypothetical protein